MRSTFSFLFLILIIALFTCAVVAHRSRKAIGKPVALLLFALIPPVAGNLIIIQSGTALVSGIGYYIYFLGMDLVMFALIRFTFAYCHFSFSRKKPMILLYMLFGLDALQYLLNPFLGQAFGTKAIMVDGFAYYKLVPYLGQGLHRMLDYVIFLAVLITFVVKAIRTPRIYSERYSIITVAMIIAGLWQTYYIFSGVPVDRSMISYGVFGLLIFYFSLYYRPRRLLDKMLAGIASEMPSALFFFDATGTCIWANEAGTALMGVENEDFETITDQIPRFFGKTELEHSDWATRCNGNDGNNTNYYELEMHVVPDDKGIRSGSFLTVRDISAEQQEFQRKLYEANHDSLTGLYTKEYLFKCIHNRLMTDREKEYLIVFVDINEFKLVNDVFGKEFGDYALQCVADRIRLYLTGHSIFGRLGGDTFGECIPADKFEPDVVEEDLSHFTVRYRNVEHMMLIHLGVYKVTDPTMDVSVMFDRARIALSTIKGEYNTHIAYYDDKMRKTVLWKQQIAEQLHKAMEERQIMPYLQPLVNTRGQVVGAEALVRWMHPQEGFLSPAAFIPVVEENGMIADLDRYMWRSACEILKKWEEDGRSDLFISVNISPKDFYFMDIVSEIKSLVREFDIPPQRLRLEITETVMMNDMENRLEILQTLKDAGFIVEMDDFGSGYSSLNLLKDMPVDVLKIDMMFLRWSANDTKAQTILRNIINLSESLGVESLSEGVETESQYEMLSQMGCKLFQGYYFAKPMSVDSFDSFCKQRKDWNSCEEV